MRFRHHALTIACAVFNSVALAQPACPPAQPSALTLADLMSRGLCLDPGVAQLQAELRRAQRAVDEAASAQAWQLSLQAGPQLTTQQGTGGGSHSVTANGSIAATRVLRDGGISANRSLQREREASAAMSELEAGRQDAIRDLATAWANARQAQTGLSAARTSLDAARASEAAARARFAAGTATRVDALTAASALAQAERDVASAETAWRRRQGVLAERMGWSADTQVTLRGDESALIDRLSSLIGSGESLGSLEAHPKLAAQRDRVRSRRDAVSASRAEEGATVEFSARSGPNFARSNSATASGRWDGTRRWGSEVGVTWVMPLSDGGGRQSRTAQNLAQLDSAQAQQEALERSLREALWQQWTAWRSADADVRASTTALDASRAAERAQRGRYEAGAGTLNDWLSAQADVSSRLRQLAESEQSRLLSAVGTTHAMGRLKLEEGQ